jgi:DNA-3-methyladenine glycosylase II
MPKLIELTSFPISLNEESLHEGITCLTKIDPNLALVVKRNGYPPLWAREPGYPTLIHIILEQQVSLASARATFVKLNDSNDSIDQLTPG